MGISSEALLAVGLILGVGLGVLVANNSAQPKKAVEANTQPASKNKKSKAKSTTESTRTLEPVKETIPGSFDSEAAVISVPEEAPLPAKSKKTKKKGKAKTSGGETSLATSQETPRSTPQIDPLSAPVVEPTPAEASGRPAAGQRRPLAERLLPKPRKTRVDDMFEPGEGQYPTVARVMRVQQPGDSPYLSTSGASLSESISPPTSDKGGDETEEHDDDDGWNIVPIKSGHVSSKASGSNSIQAKAKSPDTLSKKQRQNAARATAQKAAKALDEAQRQLNLAKHQKQLRDARIAEAYKPKKGTSGGMTSSVDNTGSLVWD